MPHDIIDNREIYLIDKIKETLPGSQAARFAVGYFFLSGLEAVADQLHNVRELRLLIGNTSNRETIEQIAEGYRRLDQVRAAVEAQTHPTFAERQHARDVTAANIGQAAALLEQTPEAERLVGVLVRLIEEGRLKVRVYTKGRLHAKAYIFDYAPLFDAQGQPASRPERGIAIVGSSNFTLSGVSLNTELNVMAPGNANHAELTAWFERLWDEAEDFEASLMQELRRAWPLAQVTPYEIYLKVLYEMVHEQLEGAEAEATLWRDDIAAVLTEFQAQAVRQAAHIIQRYGGCFVADVVGLGKSYIGAAIVKHFVRRHLARPLIICPAPLVEMWEHYNQVYQLNARVLSMGLLQENAAHGADWMAYDGRYQDRDFVLVDESHNFRNPHSQRYQVLHSFLGTGERRCCFLTATPRNKTVWDLYHQLKLFHQDDLTDLPIDPPNLRAFFKAVEAGERRLPDLLAHLLIRRTRAHILRWYGYDETTGARVDPHACAPYLTGERRAYILVGGRRQFFPQRVLETIEYSIEATYQGLYERLRACLSAGDDGQGLKFARYGLWHYVKPAKRRRKPYAELQRAGANLRGLMRVMLFKRFESSVHAFRETLQRMVHAHHAFLAALDHGIVPAGEEAQQVLHRADIEEERAFLESLTRIGQRYNAADFDVAALRADVEADLRSLSEMLALVQPITPDRDAKLQTLKARLAAPALREGKVLIFTQYADTAQYLYDNLAASPSPSPVGEGRGEGAAGEGRGAGIEVIYSQDKNKSTIVTRFAPKANADADVADADVADADVADADVRAQQGILAGVAEIDTLIATDVLSEGLNLQDCDKVINYDLHWNPVRLIQRFGRVDRIGSEHDRVYAYNFLPETALDANLGLHETLARRIAEIHATIGEDAAILDPEESVNPEAMYAIYAQEHVDPYEDVDETDYLDLNEAEALIQQIREDDPALYERVVALRDGVRCGRQAGQSGAVVLCRAGHYRQLYWVDAQGHILSRDVARILTLLKCDPQTPAEPLSVDHGDTVTRVKRRFEQEIRNRRAEREHTLALTQAQHYVLAELRMAYADAHDTDNVRPQIAILEQAFRQPLNRGSLQKALRTLRSQQLTGAALVAALTELYHLHGLDVLRDRPPPPTGRRGR